MRFMAKFESFWLLVYYVETCCNIINNFKPKLSATSLDIYKLVKSYRYKRS